MTPDEFDDLARRLKLRPSTLKKAKLSTQSTHDEIRQFIVERGENLDDRMERLIDWGIACDEELARMDEVDYDNG